MVPHPHRTHLRKQPGHPLQGKRPQQVSHLSEQRTLLPQQGPHAPPPQLEDDRRPDDGPRFHHPPHPLPRRNAKTKENLKKRPFSA